MSGSEGNEPPKPQQAPLPKKQRLNHIRPKWLSDAVLGYVSAGVATVLWVFGAALLNSLPKPVKLAWVFIGLGAMAFSWALRSWAISHRRRQSENKMPRWVPNALFAGGSALALIVPTFAIWQEKGEPPPKKPHFTFSLQTGDSPSPTPLTNESFFRAGVVQTLKSTNAFFLFNGIAEGCVVLPIQQGETNKIFSFNAENDSLLHIGDLQVAVGFPKDWQLGLDRSKWHPVSEYFLIPRWRLDITNLQFWMVQVPWTLHPKDSIDLPPVTNYTLPHENNPANRAGFVRLLARTGDYAQFLSANLVFYRMKSNTFKPFITKLHHETNGTWHISMTPEEFLASQK